MVVNSRTGVCLESDTNPAQSTHAKLSAEQSASSAEIKTSMTQALHAPEIQQNSLPILLLASAPPSTHTNTKSTPATKIQSVSLEKKIQAMTQNPVLQNALRNIATTPDGKLLINQCATRNVKIYSSEQAKKKSISLPTNVKAVATADGSSIYIKLEKLKNTIHQTVTHELVHAALGKNDQSVEEEAAACIVGDRVASAIARSKAAPGLSWVQLACLLYANDLPLCETGSTTITQQLQSIGISVGPFQNRSLRDWVNLLGLPLKIQQMRKP